MPDAVVSSDWVAGRLDTAGVRIIDVPTDPPAYRDPGHLPGAACIDWKRDLIEREDESSGLVIDAARFALLASRLGLQPDDTLIFYGDEGGRHAIRALWTFVYYRHRGPLRFLDGGRERWRDEGRPLTADTLSIPPSDYPTPPSTDESVRITGDALLAGLDDVAVLDVRNADEYAGTDARAARTGHIPGATHIFWKRSLTPDEAEMLPADELEKLYGSLPRDRDIAVHCQLGVRAAHTWFLLRHVLGYERVRVYDGSWQEWGNRQDTPIER